MKFGFVTCVQLGLACMDEIYQAGGRLDLVITLLDEQASRKSGRVRVDGFCQERGVDLFKSRNINDPGVVDAIGERGLDWLFIIGWSQIAREPVLRAPTRGAIGMHPTLLPAGRGRAAIPWAIIKGLEKTGVTMFKLDSGIDTGPIMAQEELPLAPDETATRLYDRVAAAHRRLIRRVWPLLVEDRVPLTPQDENRASVWPARRPEDGRILEKMTCLEVDRLVRAVTRPYPGAFFDTEARRFRIWSGVARPGSGVPSPSPLTGRPTLPLADGSYEPTDWEIEDIPVLENHPNIP